MMNKENWEIKKLEEVCEILDYRRKPITKKDRISGIYPYYGASGIQDYVHDYIFDGTYVLVGEDGAKWNAHDKTAFLIQGKCWVNNHAHVLEVNNFSCNQWIIYYLNQKDLNEYITGAVIPKLNQTALRNIPIPIPPLPTQEQIVDELDILNDIISKKKQQLSELDTLAQATFYDMFGDPVQNEKGWEVKALGVLGTLKNGLNYSKNEKGETLPFLSVSDFMENRIISNLNGSITLNILPPKDYFLNKNDFIFVRSNGSKELVGRCILFDSNLQNAVYSGFCIRYRLDDIAINSLFLLYIFTSKQIRDSMLQIGRGANISNINQQMLSSLPIILPPLALQNQFAERIEAIEKQKELINQSITEVQTLLDSRMDKYFD